MEQVHEAFMFVRCAKVADKLFLDGLKDTLVDLAGKVNSIGIAPKSISMTKDDAGFLFCVGYDASASYTVGFAIDLIGDATESALPDLQESMATTAEKHQVICHDIFEIPEYSGSGLLYCLFMTRL